MFTLSTGERARGVAEAAFAQQILHIPNNTFALAMIEKCEEKSFSYNGQDMRFFNVEWRLMNAPFKGTAVRQKIDIFSDNPAKADRAKEMFMLLFNLCNINPNPSGPTANDLYLLQKKICGLRIQEWELNGKTGNWVSELHPASGFVEELGIKMPSKEPKISQAHDERNPPFEDSEILF